MQGHDTTRHPTVAAAIAAVAAGRRLGETAAERLAAVLVEGAATPAQLGALLLGMRVRGETVDEIVGFARALRERAAVVADPAGDAIDTCGTGGDGLGTFNVSTAAALVAAAAGCRVAKHGNRAVSGRCGSADVLDALGVPVDATPAAAARRLAAEGLCFLFAPAHHPAARHAAPTRRELGTRTIFNLVGPLTNPAGVRRQLVGVYAPALTDTIAEALRRLGSERALVVHGEDGLDEISPAGPTRVSSLRDGAVTTTTIVPEDAGLGRHPLATIRGGGPERNAAMIRDVLRGAAGAPRDAVLLNAGAAILVAGRADTLADGVRAAAAAIDGGRAAALLDRTRRGDAAHA